MYSWDGRGAEDCCETTSGFPLHPKSRHQSCPRLRLEKLVVSPSLICTCPGQTLKCKWYISIQQQVWPLTIGGLLSNLPKYAKVRWTWRQALSCLFPIVRCLALTPILACGVIITKPLHGSEWSFYNQNWQQATHTLPEGKQQCEMGNTWQHNAPVHQAIYLSVTAYHRNSQVPITGTNILSSTLQYSAFATCFFVIPAAAEQNRQCLQLQIKFGIQYYGENLSIVAIICSSSVPTIPAESLTKSVNGPSRSVDEESVPATVLRGVRRWNATMWWTIHPASWCFMFVHGLVLHVGHLCLSIFKQISTYQYCIFP